MAARGKRGSPLFVPWCLGGYLIRMMHEVDNVVPFPSKDTTALRVMRPIAFLMNGVTPPHRNSAFPTLRTGVRSSHDISRAAGQFSEPVGGCPNLPGE